MPSEGSLDMPRLRRGLWGSIASMSLATRTSPCVSVAFVPPCVIPFSPSPPSPQWLPGFTGVTPMLYMMKA